MPHAPATPILLDIPAATLCARAYPGHPRGCPNINHKDGCPPRATPIAQVLDLSAPTHVIWNAFDLGAHVARMRRSHSLWSDRQLVNCLYWQPRARQDLRVRIREFLTEVAPPAGCRWTLVGCPEACGVNVTATMAASGVVLEWPPRTVAYQVVLAGVAVRREW